MNKEELHKADDAEEWFNNSHFVTSDFIEIDGRSCGIDAKTLFECMKAFHEAMSREDKKELKRMKSELEDVCTVIDPSDAVLEKHGPLGTAPAEILRLVFNERDIKYRVYKAEIQSLKQANAKFEYRIRINTEEFRRIAVQARVANAYEVAKKCKLLELDNEKFLSKHDKQ